MQRRKALAFAGAALTPLPGLSVADSLGSYALPNTFVHSLPDPKTGKKYELWVDLPKSYASSDRRFPTVLTTDAPYAFPLIRSIRNRVGQSGRNIEDFVLVGLAPPTNEVSTESRSRDYTPTDPRKRPRPKKDYPAREYGGAADYLSYLRSTALPYFDSQYRSDPSRRTYVGHSYGGLLGAYALVTQPELFESYVLGSPSLWFDQHVVFDIEQQAARTRRDISARVFMYCGSYETIKAEPRYFKNDNIVGDMRKFAADLSARRYRSLRIEAHVLPDEDHFTVFPSLITRALLKALPGKGPYSSG